MRENHGQQGQSWNTYRLLFLIPSAIVFYAAYLAYRDNQAYNGKLDMAAKTAQIIRDGCRLETQPHRETEKPYCRDFRSMYKICLGDKDEGCRQHGEIQEVREYACKIGKFFFEEANHRSTDCDPDILDITNDKLIFKG